MQLQIDNQLGVNSANVWAKGIVGSLQEQSSELTEIMKSKKIVNMLEKMIPPKVTNGNRRLKASPVQASQKELYSKKQLKNQFFT